MATAVLAQMKSPLENLKPNHCSTVNLKVKLETKMKLNQLNAVLLKTNRMKK